MQTREGGDLRDQEKTMTVSGFFKDSGLCPKNLGNHCGIFKPRGCKISILKISQVAVVRSVAWRGPTVPAGGPVGLQREIRM